MRKSYALTASATLLTLLAFLPKVQASRAVQSVEELCKRADAVCLATVERIEENWKPPEGPRSAAFGFRVWGPHAGVLRIGTLLRPHPELDVSALLTLPFCEEEILCKNFNVAYEKGQTYLLYLAWDKTARHWNILHSPEAAVSVKGLADPAVAEVLKALEVPGAEIPEKLRGTWEKAFSMHGDRRNGDPRWRVTVTLSKDGHFSFDSVSDQEIWLVDLVDGKPAGVRASQHKYSLHAEGVVVGDVILLRFDPAPQGEEERAAELHLGYDKVLKQGVVAFRFEKDLLVLQEGEKHSLHLKKVPDPDAKP